MSQVKFGFGSFLKGLAIGSVLAGITVLLTAPHSGVETRQMLQEKGEQIQEQSKRALESARERMDMMISDTRDQAEMVAQRIGRQLNTIPELVKPTSDMEMPRS
jgi:gas vesicle protein